MEFKGTKGKWKLDGIDEDLYMVSSDLPVQGNIICMMPDEEFDESRANWESNAQLIAAAPELLEALIDLVLECESQTMETSSNESILKSKQAINKALGL